MTLPSHIQEDRDTIKNWQRLYEVAAEGKDWLAAHRWGYGEEVGKLAAQDVRTKLRVQPEDRVLEVGCGSGTLLSLVLHPDQRGVGFDLCEALVHRKNDFAIQPQRLSLGVCEAGDVPVRSSLYDKVFSYSVFQCFPTDEYTSQVIDELMRVCKPGGTILIGDIFGMAEKQRQQIMKLGIPEWLTNMLMWFVTPLWCLRYRFQRFSDGVRRRVFSRKFFRRALSNHPCTVEFLYQSIEGRTKSNTRYDVRIVKLQDA